MLIVRKVDRYIEIAIIIIMIITIPVLSIYGFLMGLFILGIIQLISAALNTQSFLHNGFKKRIKNYWLFTIIDLLSLYFGSVSLNNGFYAGMIQVIVISGATAIAIYYLFIYKKLTDLLELRNELAGFTKS